MLRALKNEYIISPQLEKRVEDFFRHAALWNSWDCFGTGLRVYWDH